MDKAKLIIEAAQRLLKVVEDLRSLADSVQAVCALVTDSLPEKTAEAKPEEKAASEIPLEKVRGVLAEKSRSGHTAEVRAIIQKYGADRLSDIDPKDYPAVLAEAEVL
ncbi:MAG: rRNA biogenesis protein rrp5 [Clostridia bacterium]|nr:rRNA biogenesis protein rrp5 [Clostridia bacterium]